MIQQIKPGSIAELDGRLQVGDHIVKLNGVDLSINTHKEVADLFAKTTPTCKMTVYRESLNENEDAKSNFTEGNSFNNQINIYRMLFIIIIICFVCRDFQGQFRKGEKSNDWNQTRKRKAV